MTVLERLKLRTQEPDEAVLEDMLESAKAVICRLRYGNRGWPTDVEPQYQDLQLRIAEDMFNRIGGAGQLSHSENGVSRSWGAEWVSEQLLREIVPLATPIG